MRVNLLAKALHLFLSSTQYSVSRVKSALSGSKAICLVEDSSRSLFDSTCVGSLVLKNRIVMAPMSRYRAVGNMATELMAEYYGQRSGAGLIITEATAPSESGLGYARMAGIYTDEQLVGWKKVTDAVHLQGGVIFVQLMHCGRLCHPSNMPLGAEIVAPSAIQASGQIRTDMLGMQDFPVPKAMSYDDLLRTKQDFVKAAKNAMQVGFDGVELHAANGFLLEQFLSPLSNCREDEYGGTIENRSRFVLEVTSAVAQAIGKSKTAIRLSPCGLASDLPGYPELDPTFVFLAKGLENLGVEFIHLVDHSSMGNPTLPFSLKTQIRNSFSNTLILSGGYHQDTAEEDIRLGLGDLVAFGRPYINNPDLAQRFKNHWPLSHDFKMNLFYTQGKEGYTDYSPYTN